MAVPKRRTSRTARDTRRANHDKINVPAIGHCPKCGEHKQPHRVCAACGYYADTLVIEKPEAPSQE